jgi:hypothetical protein
LKDGTARRGRSCESCTQPPHLCEGGRRSAFERGEGQLRHATDRHETQGRPGSVAWNDECPGEDLCSGRLAGASASASRELEKILTAVEGETGTGGDAFTVGRPDAALDFPS